MSTKQPHNPYQPPNATVADIDSQASIATATVDPRKLRLWSKQLWPIALVGLYCVLFGAIQLAAWILLVFNSGPIMTATLAPSVLLMALATPLLRLSTGVGLWLRKPWAAYSALAMFIAQFINTARVMATVYYEDAFNFGSAYSLLQNLMVWGEVVFLALVAWSAFGWKRRGILTKRR